MERRDLVLALPAELSAECFRLLDLKACIRVSHVSRAWRAAALSDGRLWNRYSLSYGSRRYASTSVNALSTLLARSDPLPFHVDCKIYPDDIPLDVYDVVFAHSHRMRELKLDGVLSRLLQQDWPLLKRLTCVRNYDGLAVIPDQWGAQNAPRLEYLHVDGFSLPPGCQPFASLRTLDARLPPPTGSFDISFSHVFPNLTDLELYGVTQDSISMLLPLPPSVRTVELNHKKYAVDYGPLLRSLCSPCRITRLRLYGSSCGLDALVHFQRVYSGPVIMKLDVYLDLEDSSGEVSWHISCKEHISLRREPGFAAHLRRLSKAQLHLTDFLSLLQLPADAWDRQLPSLCSLLLFVEVDSPEQPRISGGDIARIQMPALELATLFVVREGELGDWFALDASALLPLLFAPRGSAKTLPRLHIVGNVSTPPSREDVAPFLSFAERVSIGRSHKLKETDLIFEAQSVTE